MSRSALLLLAFCILASAQDAVSPEETPAVRLRMRLKAGDRVVGSNVVSYTIVTTERQGQKTTSREESVQRTERFVDEVVRAGFEIGALEIERSYLQLFSKARTPDIERPRVHRSPMQGRTVKITERTRRREVASKGRGAVDPFVRRTAGLEIDWRDIFPADPVRPGDAWKADADALAHRLAAYLDTGAKSSMRARFEQIVVREGRKQAKLYVDWTIEGMRDRRFFTKVLLAGDVYFDFALERVVEVDLQGTITVRGAIIGSGQPKIVKGEGPVRLKTVVKPAPIEAAVDDDR